MKKELLLTVSAKNAANSNWLKKEVARKLEISINEIRGITIIRKSLDARSKEITTNLKLQVFYGKPEADEAVKPHEINYRNVEGKPEAIIVGAGPAGLFAALRLIELGICPIVLERGKNVSERKRDVALLNRGVDLNPESNYCYGEGGAGTFSDGKLYTRSKKHGDNDNVLQILHHHGAPDEILYEAYPHIGTNLLPRVIKNIRQTILSAGGKVLFNTRVDDLIIRDQQIEGVITQAGDKITAQAVILATGHSARDVYQILHKNDIALEAKGFAMGVRVEHPQELVDEMQYHRPKREAYLPPASYNFVEQVDGCGVYSFCMCPGGFIVPAFTNANEIVVNGMSPTARNSPFANAGFVVEVKPNDWQSFSEHGVFAGLKYQESIENLAFVNGGGKWVAPAQCMHDFVNKHLSKSLPETSYYPGLVTSPVHFWLPEAISSRLRQAFKQIGAKRRGFLTNRAIVVGVETRTSSPIRIPRNTETLEHPVIARLFPSGEGAGYAGGIVSSAIDGIRCAESAAQLYFKSEQV